MKQNLLKNTSKKLILISIVSIIIGFIIIFGLNYLKTRATTETFTSVFDESLGLVSQGTIHANDVSINSKLPGRIVTVFVTDGQSVAAGDKLVEISSGELLAKKQQAEAAITQAKAGLLAAEGQLSQATAGINASNALISQAKSGVEASKALVAQVQAAIKASNGKVSEAEAGHAASVAQQGATQSVNDKAEKGARDQEIAQAQSYYDLMVSSYERVLALEQKGAVSKQKLEEVKTQMDVAEQTLSMAKEGARVEDKAAASAVNEQAKAGITASLTRVDQANAGLEATSAQLLQAMAGESASNAQLTQAMAGLQSSNAVHAQAAAGVELRKGQITQAEGALAEVMAYIKDTIITSPIDGTITALSSKEGELVSSGMSMATVSNIKQPWIEVDVPETDIEKVHSGQKVTIKCPAYSQKQFTGTVSNVNKQPDFAVKRATSENGNFDIVSYKVKIEIDPSDEDILYAGLTSYVQFAEQ